MHIKNNAAVGVTVLTIIAGGALAIPRTFAADTDTGSPMNTLVEKIASKFNLNKEEVQAVFDEERATRHEKMQTDMKVRTEERLSQAVTDGDLTQAQKDLITAKLTEVQAKQTEISNISDQEDRKAAMDQLRADLSKWAADNNIDSKYLMFGSGRGGRGMHGKGMYGQGRNSSFNRGFSTSSSDSSTVN